MSDWRRKIGLEYVSETVKVWVKNKGAATAARRIKPFLSEAQKKRRIDFIRDQMDKTTGNYRDHGIVIHLDKS